MMSELVDVLRYAGVERVYGVGEARLKPIAEAIGGIDGMAWVEVRNEQAAALAAAHEALSSGRLAVCAGSYGPGRTHLIRGLYDAHRSGAPVLAVASHISNEDTDDAIVGEIHPERLFAECSNYCGLVGHPSEMPWLARTAMQHALVRGGVSVLLLNPPAETNVQDHVDRSASCRISGSTIDGRQPLVRAHYLPLHAACAVSRRRQHR
jgi:pyruvate dehydrogenase (quinone)